MNRVTVTIAERQFTLLVDDETTDTQKVAEYVDGRLSELLNQGKLSLADACVLTAMNVTQELFQEQASSDNLRRQLKEYLEESTKLKLELSEAKREIFALKGKR